MSKSTAGSIADADAGDIQMSDDGRYVVFYSSSELTHVTHSLYHLNYVYLRDRSAGTKEFITIPRWWWPAIIAGGTQAQLADDGSSVVFSDAARYQESPSNVHRPIVRRARDGSSNLMSLTMYDSLWNGSSFTATGYDALPSSPFWVLRSSNVSGFSYQGHRFDLGSPITTMGSGTSDATGKITWTSAPLPSIAAGHTVYIELASRSAATWSDSNYVKFTIY